MWLIQTVTRTPPTARSHTTAEQIFGSQSSLSSAPSSPVLMSGAHDPAGKKALSSQSDNDVGTPFLAETGSPSFSRTTPQTDAARLLLELAGGNGLLGERRTSESLQPARQDNDVASDGSTATMVFRETSTSLTASRQPVTVEGSMRSVTTATVDALTSKDVSGLSLNKDVSHVVQGSPSHAQALTRRFMRGVRQEPDLMLNGLSELGNSVDLAPRWPRPVTMSVTVSTRTKRRRRLASSCVFHNGRQLIVHQVSLMIQLYPRPPMSRHDPLCALISSPSSV